MKHNKTHCKGKKKTGAQKSGSSRAKMPAVRAPKKSGSKAAGRRADASCTEKVTGVVEMSTRGFGFLICPGRADVFIPARDLNGAVHGDTVQAAMTGYERAGGECEVVKVLRRKHQSIVGTYFSEKNYGFCVPDDIRIAREIYIPQGNGGGARHLDKVVIQIANNKLQITNDRRGTVSGKKSGSTFHESRAVSHESRTTGTVIEVLGKIGAKGVDMLSVARSYGLSEVFPPSAAKEAKAVAVPVSASEISRRCDFRGEHIFTIDGDDAKDFDDAVGLTVNGRGNYLLGVHIADVAHYVTENSALDKEALRRGTSVYFCDRAIPMLPEELSCGICSLKEGEERLTLSVLMEIDGAGGVISFELCEGVINSRARLTYSQVAEILGDRGQGSGVREEEEKNCHGVGLIDSDAASRRSENGSSLNQNGTAVSKPDPLTADIGNMLREMEKLAEILNQKRKGRGCIDFDLPECEIVLDESGKAVEIRRRPRLVSHRIIEEFMLAANEVVAEFAVKRNLPFIYRVHEDPPAEKAEALADFLKGLGLGFGEVKRKKEKGKSAVEAEESAFRGQGLGDKDEQSQIQSSESRTLNPEPRIPNPESRIPGLTPRDFADLLSSVAGLPHETAVSKAVLRAMSKACYLPENLGHFGLAAKNYCHFTSPIRRYPDLWIHRVIKGLGVRGQGLGELGVRNSSAIADIALQSSSREREAEKAERDADELKKAEYMSDKIGMRFFGVIGGVTERGIFVELENTVEGMVRAESLPGTGFSFNERLMTLQAGAHTYRIGDTVEIEVLAVTGSKIEFGLA